MPVGAPPAQIVNDYAGVYREAELELLHALRDAVDRGAATGEIRAEAEAATQLRRAADRVAARLNAMTEEQARRAIAAAARYGDAAARAELSRIAGEVAAQAETAAVAVDPALIADLVAVAASPMDDAFDPLTRGPLRRIARELADLMIPVHLAVTRNVRDVYQAVTARASAATAIGVLTRREASQKALDEYARRGVSGFTDKAGRRWELVTYAEMAVRSTTARASVAAGVDRITAGGIDLVFVSQHPGECKLCSPWSGKILHATSGYPGRIQVPSYVSDDLLDVDVAGALPGAMAAGLLHPNCRHAVSAYLPGATRIVPPPIPARRPASYEDNQRQRALERRIRAAKREQAVAFTDEATTRATRKVRDAQAAMRAHLERTGLPRMPEREQIHRAR